MNETRQLQSRRLLMLITLLLLASGQYGCFMLWAMSWTSHDHGPRHSSVVNEDCSEALLDADQLRDELRPNVVRVLVDGVPASTGFAIYLDEEERDRVLIATSYRAVVLGETFGADWEDAGNATKRVEDLELIKVAPEDNIALLRGTSPELNVSGLRLNRRPIKPGERVATLSYSLKEPSSFPLTIASGTVTKAIKTDGRRLDNVTTDQEGAVERSFVSHRTLIEAQPQRPLRDAGGPVTDACGNVVGIATEETGRHTDDNTSLFVPVSRLTTLLDMFEVKFEPALLLSRLFNQKLRGSYCGAHLLSRRYLTEHVQPLFEHSLEALQAKITEISDQMASEGFDWSLLGVEEQMEILTYASGEESRAWSRQARLRFLLLYKAAPPDPLQNACDAAAFFIDEYFGEGLFEYVRDDYLENDTRSILIGFESYKTQTTRRYFILVKQEGGHWVIDDIRPM